MRGRLCPQPEAAHQAMLWGREALRVESKALAEVTGSSNPTHSQCTGEASGSPGQTHRLPLQHWALKRVRHGSAPELPPQLLLF